MNGCMMRKFVFVLNKILYLFSLKNVFFEQKKKKNKTN